MAQATTSSFNLKRARSKNFTQSQCLLLVKAVSDRKVQLFGAQSNLVSNDSKSRAWDEVTDCVNSKLGSGEDVKDREQVKKKWDNLVQNAKQAYDRMRKYSGGTGGGAPKRLSEVDEVIINEILEENNPTLVGVLGGIDSMRPTTSAEAADEESAFTENEMALLFGKKAHIPRVTPTKQLLDTPKKRKYVETEHNEHMCSLLEEKNKLKRTEIGVLKDLLECNQGILKCKQDSALFTLKSQKLQLEIMKLQEDLKKDYGIITTVAE